MIKKKTKKNSFKSLAKGKTASNKIKAVIFDYGGVVANDVRGMIVAKLVSVFKVNKKMILKYYYPIKAKYKRGKLSTDQFWNEFAKKLNKKIKKNQYMNVLEKGYAKRTKQRKYMIDVIKTLKKRGYKIALLSNSLPPFSRYNINNNKYSIFQYRLISDKECVAKPDKSAYRLMLKKLRLPAKNCVFIDDKTENIKGAEKVGIKGIVFTTKKDLIKELKKLGVNI